MPLFSRPPKPNWLTHPSRQANAQQQVVTKDAVGHNTPSYANGVYYPSWRIYRQQPPSSMILASASHAFYAFARVKPDGTVYLHDDYADAQIEVDGTKGCLNALVLQKQQHSHLKVILSIGGGGEGSNPFAAVASNQATRQTFATSSRALVDAYKLDGIDIDWEHPSDPSQGADYVRLLTALRASLPSPHYVLTTALPAGEWALRNIDVGQASVFLDYINVMAYDFSGPWTSTTGYQSQLYTPKSPHSDAATTSCQSSVNYLISKGVPSRKLLLGIPAYGRSFLGADKIGKRFAGQGGEEGVFEYRDLPRPGTKEQVDTKVVAAYCIGGDGGFVTYDNPDTVHLKAGFVKQNKLGGVFFWTGTGDVQGPRSLVETAYKSLHGPS